jgi:membrane protease YdiL (CAAX protease family)
MMEKPIRFALIVLACALIAVWLVALLVKPPSLTVGGWLRQDPWRAAWIAGLVIAVAIWWCKPLHWRDFEDRDHGNSSGGMSGGL